MSLTNFKWSNQLHCGLVIGNNLQIKSWSLIKRVSIYLMRTDYIRPFFQFKCFPFSLNIFSWQISFPLLTISQGNNDYPVPVLVGPKFHSGFFLLVDQQQTHHQSLTNSHNNFRNNSSPIYIHMILVPELRLTSLQCNIFGTDIHLKS